MLLWQLKVAKYVFNNSVSNAEVRFLEACKVADIKGLM